MLHLIFNGLNRAYAESTFLPPAATKVAEQFDKLYYFLVWASAISCVLVIGGFIVFALKYRRRSDNDKVPYISHNNTLEFLWSFIPFVIFMVVFVWGWWIYHLLATPPKGALEIHVTGQKWFWNFAYKSGKKSDGELYVPVGEDVKLIMTSNDVIHSFYVPAFRVKQDVVPGRYSALWFRAEYPGIYQVFCTEYCGDQHSAMLAKVHVLPKPDFEKWLSEADPYLNLSMAEVGQKVYAGKCMVCHNTTQERKVGPGLGGAFGKTHEFEEGGSAVVDENYLRESILVPTAKTVKGYAKGAMPSFQGQLSEKELAGVIEYIKQLK
jgi:cytochrome c oxidase subunit 2